MTKYKHTALVKIIDANSAKTCDEIIIFFQHNDPELLKEISNLLKTQLNTLHKECLRLEAIIATVVRAAFKLERPQQVITEFIKMGNDFDNYNFTAFPINTVYPELKPLTEEFASKAKVFSLKSKLLEIVTEIQRQTKVKSNSCWGFFAKEKSSTESPSFCKKIKNSC